MNSSNLKDGQSVCRKKEVYYLLDDHGKPRKYKPWLGDAFAFLYDRIMEKSVFPKKFNASIDRHFQILTDQLKGLQDKSILEIAAGSGNAARFLPREVDYTATDISYGLLKRAARNFKRTGYRSAEFYIADAADLPFKDQSFDVAMCHLSVNFFDDMEAFLSEVKRVLKPGGHFFGSLPLPEKKPPKATIRGRLYSAEELQRLFQERGFHFDSLPAENGALIYWKATYL